MVVPDQAEVVRRIYKQYLTGASLRMIQETLESEQIPNVEGKAEWTLNVIRGILTNEKYYGDVLMQKTYVNDCISRKTIRNNWRHSAAAAPQPPNEWIWRHPF